MISTKINQQFFFSNIKQILARNMNDKAIASLAGLIALDYDLRLKNKFSEINYVKIVIHRLKLFLQNKIIDDNNFSTIMMLFTEAIKNENSDSGVIQAQNIDVIIDMLIASCFSEYKKDDLIKIKVILTNVINDLGADKVFRFITSNVDIFKSYINATLQKNVQQIDLRKLNKLLNTLIYRANSIEIKIGNFRQAVAKISLAFSALSITAFSVFSSSVLIPVLLLPALLVTIKIAPKIGNLLGKAVLKTDWNIQAETKNITLIKKKFGLLTNIKQLPVLDLITQQQLAYELAREASYSKNNPPAYAGIENIKQKTNDKNRVR